MNNPNDREHWNEFEWELELRKDDARIASYIAELPRYIDLPNEDGIIMNDLKKRPELAPAGGNWNELGPGPADFDEDDDEEAPGEDPHAADWPEADGGFIYTTCAGLARDWSVCFASLDKPELAESFMRVLTYYGKIMARSADLIDLSLEEKDGMDPAPIPYKIAACKRFLADLNLLMGEFKKFQEPPASAWAAAHLEALGKVRAYAVDLLFRFRNPPEKENA